MSVESDIKLALSSSAVLTSALAGRIYPIKLPQQTTFPALTWQRLSTVRTTYLGSVTLDKGYTGIARARFSFITWGDVYADVVTVADAVRSVLMRLALVGPIGENTVEQEFDQIDPESGLYQRYMDIMIWFKEAGRDG